MHSQRGRWEREENPVCSILSNVILKFDEIEPTVLEH